MSSLRSISIKAVCLCLLLVACGPNVDITPQPVSDENRARLERRVKPGYTLREVYQHSLGDSEAVHNDRLLEPNGVVVAGLIDGFDVEGSLVMLYFGPDNGRIVNFAQSRYLEVGSIYRPYGEYDNARALGHFVEGLRQG